MRHNLPAVAILAMLQAVPAIAQSSTGINAPNNKGIVTKNQSGGTNIINQGPPRLPLALYQYGEQIGLVAGFSESADKTKIFFKNPVIASGTVDFSKNMEFRNLIVSCPALTPPGGGHAAFVTSRIIGTVPCAVEGHRHP
jgi:hypothetical protein